MIPFFCREIRFFLNTTPDESNLDSLDEGLEFGYRNDSEWIPLAFFSSLVDQDNVIKVGEQTGNNLITIRGYSVPFILGDTHSVQLKLCGSDIIQDNASLIMSFRWLQTVRSSLASSVDDIAIDNVQISIMSPTQQLNVELLTDNFNNQINIR